MKQISIRLISLSIALIKDIDLVSEISFFINRYTDEDIHGIIFFVLTALGNR
jgi:hypothetical protein